MDRTTELQAKREAEAERRARIKQVNERAAALPADDRGRVHRRAQQLEAEARRNGRRMAHDRFLEAALDEHDARELDRATVTAVAALGTDLTARARGMREAGLTVAEIAGELDVGAAAVQAALAGAPRGKPAVPRQRQKGRGEPKATARRARESRGGAGVDRQEKCPACGKWRCAERNGDGKYVVEADFREGRQDCRECYNRRWREGNERRKAQKAAKKK